METPKLTTAQRKRIRSWVAELRKTRRKQGTGLLNYSEQENGKKVRKYCCLGIACEAAIKDGLELGKKIDKKPGSPELLDVVSYFDPKRSKDIDDSLLPEVVAKWFGFKYHSPCTETWVPDNDPSVKTEEGQTKPASTLNDLYDKSFGEIADAVERAYLPKDWQQTLKNRKAKETTKEK